MNPSASSHQSPRVAHSAFAGCLLLLGACGGGTPAAAPLPAAAQTVVPRDTALVAPEALSVAGITVSQATRVAWRDAWQLPARVILDPVGTQALGSIVEGRVTQVFVQVGDRVRRGEVLVTIHSHELTAAHNALQQANAGRIEADNAAQLAGAAAARSERLLVAQAGSQADVERAGAAKVAAEAGRRRAAAEYERASEMVAHLRAPGPLSSRIDPEDVIVRAPFDGVVVSRSAVPGAVVIPGSSLIMVSRSNAVLLEMRVPEAALAAARVGSEVRFSVPAFPGRSFTARVTRVAPALDSLSRTADVFASVGDRGSELRSGMSASAELFGLARDSVTAVPVGAIQDFEGDTIVVTGVTRGAGLLLEAHRVRVGRRSGGLAEVLIGLPVGAPVVTGGASLAKAEILRQRDARAAAESGAPQ